MNSDAKGSAASVNGLSMVALHRGPLLEGCAEEWVLGERLVREHAYLRPLEPLADRAYEPEPGCPLRR